MIKVHIIIHESFESEGAIKKWAHNKGNIITYTRTFAGDKLPKDTEEFDFLIVMGGSQSPATSKTECPHFDSAAEQMLIKQAIDTGKLVLGVCLGAQLIGEALGAKCERSPNKEIGVFEIFLTQQGKNDPVFSKFPKIFSVAHWHGDMPGLTEKAQVLASSKGCPRQVIRYTPKVYGFQCHLEFTQETVDKMIENCRHEFEETGEYIQDANILRTYNYHEMNQKLFDFLDFMQERKELYES